MRGERDVIPERLSPRPTYDQKTDLHGEGTALRVSHTIPDEPETFQPVVPHPFRGRGCPLAHAMDRTPSGLPSKRAGQQREHTKKVKLLLLLTRG